MYNYIEYVTLSYSAQDGRRGGPGARGSDRRSDMSYMILYTITHSFNTSAIAL